MKINEKKLTKTHIQKTTKKYSKRAFLEERTYRNNWMLLDVLLEEDKKYSKQEVNEYLEKYKNMEVLNNG